MTDRNSPLHQSSSGWIRPTGEKELVSIVIPTFNRAELVEQTLYSLATQTYRPLEIIVVDDASSDNTEKVVSSLLQNSSFDVRFRYIRQPEQAGAPAARNTGTCATTGEFITFMDDDDIASQDFVKSRIDALKSDNTNCDLAYGPWQPFHYIDGRYLLLARRDVQPLNSNRTPWEAFLLNWPLLLQGCVIRRSLVSEVGPWNDVLQKSQDLEYKARLIALGCKPVFVDQGLIFYRLHADSITGKRSAAKLRSYVNALDCVEKLAMQSRCYENHRELLGNYFWRHAFWLYARKAFRSGNRELQRAKKHSSSILRQKGILPLVLSILRLENVIGPAYYGMASIKRHTFPKRPEYVSNCSQLLESRFVQ